MLEKILPIAIFILIGYLFKVFKRDISKELIEFALYFSLPSFVINKIYFMKIDETFWKILIVAYFSIFFAAIIAYYLGKYLKLEKKDLGSFILVSSMGNTAFIGFPYIGAFYGDIGLSYALIFDQFGSFIALMTFAIVVISWAGGGGESSGFIMKKAFLSPVMIFVFIALFLRNFEIPKIFLNFTQMLEASLIPVVTIVVGMKLELTGLTKNIKESFLAVIIKMAVTPIVVMIIIFTFFDKESIWAKTSILESGMPAMLMAVVFSIAGGLNQYIAINALFFGVIFSFLTIPYLYFLLN